MSAQNPYAAPTSEGLANYGSGEHLPLTLKQKLFSFQGRISRAGYWGYLALYVMLPSFLISIPFYVIFFISMMQAETSTTGLSPLLVLVAILTTILSLPLTWISFAVIAKRFHDRGKSGWMSLISFIPYVGAIWILIDCGCLAGEKGHNKYGADPLLADGKTPL